MLESLEGEKNNLEKYVTKIDQNLSEVQAKIDELDTLITQKEDQIAKTTKALEEARIIEEEQYQSMKSRIKFMYERGGNFYLELFFSAESFADLLNKAEYIDGLSSYDRRMLDEYVANKQLIELTKELMEAEQALLEETKNAQKAERENLESLLNAKNQQLKTTQTDIHSKQQQIDEYNAELKAMADTISMLEAIIAEEKRKILEANGELLKYDGGKFAFPAPSYTSISSPFGNRLHPILGVPLFHNGVDLAAPGGSRINAAYNGKIVAASYTSVMGNYIMIDHGDGIYTVYMHASALYVKEGDIVARGQKIAAVGTTGRSSGNHLHFSVRVNGNYVDPMGYISK